MATSNYSSRDLFAFLEWATKRHVVKKNTADSWKTAAQKVLETLDASEQEDLRNLDVDTTLQRFENHAGRNYKPASLRVYRSRFATALDQFLKWKANPSGYKPDARVKSTRSKPNKPPLASQHSQPKSRATAAAAPIENSSEPWMLPIPLRPGVLVKIFGLPVDLTKIEARKISAVVTALADEGGE